MDQVYLPEKSVTVLQDLMKTRKVTQAELAAKIGCSESALSRFISGKTDKLGDESIIRIARAFPRCPPTFCWARWTSRIAKTMISRSWASPSSGAESLYAEGQSENRQLPSGKSAVCRHHIPDRQVSG